VNIVIAALLAALLALSAGHAGGMQPNDVGGAGPPAVGGGGGDVGGSGPP